MKTKKAYGLWSPQRKSLSDLVLFDTMKGARQEASFYMHREWPDLRKEGYRVIPVTITYEEPEK
jgi:hypothetical protein